MTSVLPASRPPASVRTSEAIFLRPVLVALFVLMLAAPALAQTTASPIQGNYSEVYVIAGRAIDSAGYPLSGARLLVELDQKGVTAEPLRAVANCKGDFITDFNLRHVDPKGKVRVSLVRRDNSVETSTTVGLDPFYRRSDALIRSAERWDGVCTNEVNVWNVSASVSVRLLNRTDAYSDDGEDYHARPFPSTIKMRYETPDGNTICPPHPQDQSGTVCEQFTVDIRGDLRYTFTLDKPFEAGGRVELIFPDETSVHVPISKESRLGVKYFEMTGRGVPPELYETPGIGLGAIGLALLASVALMTMFRRR